MTRLTAYDVEAREIEKICEDNDTTEAEVIEALMEHIKEVKEEQGWK